MKLLEENFCSTLSIEHWYIIWKILNWKRKYELFHFHNIELIHKLGTSNYSKNLQHKHCRRNDNLIRKRKPRTIPPWFFINESSFIASSHSLICFIAIITHQKWICPIHLCLFYFYSMTTQFYDYEIQKN